MSQEQSFSEILAGLAGTWQGETKTWFEPGKLTDTQQHSAEIRTIASTSLAYSYAGRVDGNEFQGLMIIALNKISDEIEAAWSDSFHMAEHMMLLKGNLTSTGLSVAGEYFVVPGVSWGWRTEFELAGQDSLAIRSYNIEPGEAEMLGLETILEPAS